MLSCKSSDETGTICRHKATAKSEAPIVLCPLAGHFAAANLVVEHIEAADRVRASVRLRRNLPGGVEGVGQFRIREAENPSWIASDGSGHALLPPRFFPSIYGNARRRRTARRAQAVSAVPIFSL